MSKKSLTKEIVLLVKLIVLITVVKILSDGFVEFFMNMSLLLLALIYMDLRQIRKNIDKAAVDSNG